jgi:hypothetical protein
LDEGNAQTACEVNTANEDTSVVLLSGIELKEQQVADVPVDVTRLSCFKRMG